MSRNKVDNNGSGNIEYDIISGSHADEIRRELDEKEVIIRTPEQLAARIINIRAAMTDCLQHYQHFSGYVCNLNEPDLAGQFLGESCEGLTDLLDDFQMFMTTVDTLRNEHSKCLVELKVVGKGTQAD